MIVDTPDLVVQNRRLFLLVPKKITEAEGGRRKNKEFSSLFFIYYDTYPKLLARVSVAYYAYKIQHVVRARSIPTRVHTYILRLVRALSR